MINPPGNNTGRLLCEHQTKLRSAERMVWCQEEVNFGKFVGGRSSIHGPRPSGGYLAWMVVLSLARLWIVGRRCWGMRR